MCFMARGGFKYSTEVGTSEFVLICQALFSQVKVFKGALIF